MSDRIRARAFAKINLTLRVTGVRRDGYHELRTVFQSLALHDTLTCRRTRGPFRLECDDPSCAADRSNLVWRAAEAVWAAAGRRGAIGGAEIFLRKRIPLQAGLGGGSSDAAAALRLLAALWRAPIAPRRLREIAGALGADVPYFLEGGTALGLDRGDLLFPLADLPPHWVVLLLPAFGVSTSQAFAWWDGFTDPPATVRRGASPLAGLPDGELVNDLQTPVAANHPQIDRLTRALERAGAVHASMSGSGSAVFGLFETEAAARRATRPFGRGDVRLLVTRTVSRRRFRAGW